MSRPTTALVIGGGIAGSATALALCQAGIEPLVCEARPAPADEGAMLTVATNGLAALRALGADERVLEASFATPRHHLAQRGGQAARRHPHGTEPPARTMQRSALAGALRDEALARGVALEDGRRLVALAAEGDGVRATFADGTEHTADVRSAATASARRSARSSTRRRPHPVRRGCSTPRASRGMSRPASHRAATT